MTSNYLVPLLFLVACSGVEVSTRPLGPRTFLVEAVGQGATSTAEALEAAHRQAAAKCGGEYHLLDTAHTEQGTYGAATFEVVLTVECGAATPAR